MARRGGPAYAPGVPMSLGALIALSLALGAAAWLFFVWTVRSGQYDDPEGPKYRMMDDDEGEAAPGRHRTGGDASPDGVPPPGAPAGRSGRARR